MAQYGYVMPVSEYKKQLTEINRDYSGRKTWENLYGSIDFARQQQIEQLTKDYSDTVAEAYAAAYKNNVAVMSSNLGQGYKAAAIEETDTALEEAYDAYRKNYLQGISEVETASAEAEAAVTEALTEQAKYTKEFQNAPYEYLKYLCEKQQSGELLDAKGNAVNLFDEELWKRYTYEVLDEEGKPTGERALKSWEQIADYGAYNIMTDKFGQEQKEWTGFYDESGNLTIKGADFYDQMINQLASEGRGVSFGKWLSETNQELYNWSQSYNPYDYTVAGTNLGSFKTMAGLTSTDETYQFIERFGGLSRKELDTMFKGFTSKVNELNNKVSSDSGRGSKDLTTEFRDLTAEVEKLTDQLGITASLEDELGMSMDDLGTYLSDLASASVSNGDIWWQGIQTGLETTGSGAVMGAKFGGGWGALAGAIVGAIVGAGVGIHESKKTKEQNRELAKASRDAYNNLVTTLIAYSQQQQRQAQINYYNK